jgi:hypothetical protein
MTSALILYVYAYTLAEVLLDIGAVYFSYRLTKLTGAFRGWVLMIFTVILIAVQGVGSLVSQIALFPESQLEQLILSIGIGFIVYSSVLGLATSIVLFSAMYELFRTFTRVKRQSAQNA